MEFIAHRFGNSVELLRTAEPVADVIEVDVHLGQHNRVEVRHAKILWPTRRLWDRWYVLPRAAEVPLFADVLDAADDGTAFWLDLKGFTTRLSRRAAAAVDGRSNLTVSTKSWWILGPFRQMRDCRVIRSAGNKFELALLMRASSDSVDGVVLHQRLLTPAVVEELRRFGDIFSWGVTDVAEIDRLDSLGISGVILDDLSLIERT